MNRLFVLAATATIAGVFFLGQAVRAEDPPPPPNPCEEHPEQCQLCKPAVGKTPTGQTCTRGCSILPCPTWHNCVVFTTGGCNDDTKPGTCTPIDVPQLVLFISDCHAYSDCPNPQTEDRCDWVPTNQICGQQDFHSCN